MLGMYANLEVLVPAFYTPGKTQKGHLPSVYVPARP